MANLLYELLEKKENAHASVANFTLDEKSHKARYVQDL